MKLALAGDTMLGRGVAKKLSSSPSESLFAPQLVEIAREADLFLLNLECCISERGSPTPGRVFHFRAPPVAAEALAHLGVSCVTLANNHALDFGPAALADTVEHLRRVGIAAVVREPVMLDAEGFRLAVVGLTARTGKEGVNRLGFLKVVHTITGRARSGSRLRCGAGGAGLLRPMVRCSRLDTRPPRQSLSPSHPCWR